MIDFLANIFWYVMEFCHALIPSYLWDIVLFTLITKILLLPVSLWSNRNGLKMVSVMPAVNRIKAEFYGDHERVGDEQAAMYKKEHYHPFLTFVPLALQIIVLLGMIGVIHMVTDTGLMPALGLVPSQDGGWTWIMPLLAGGASVVLGLAQNRINPLQREQSRAEQWTSNGLSIAISLVLGAFVSVGVAVYWIFSNLFTILVQLACNAIEPPAKYVDYEALRESREALEKLDAIGSQPVSKEAKRREKADYKAFFKVANKHIVFYSESSGFYKYFENIIAELLRCTNVVIHYVTSDPDDQIFTVAAAQPRIRPYYIGEKKLITLFIRMDADIVVMTVPDLESYHLKRSRVRKDVEYVYVFHGMFTGLSTLRAGALDHFDTLLTPAPGFEDEMRAWNRQHGLADQRMVPCGYGVIDNMAAQYERMDKTENAVKKVLIAPSWQPDNAMELCLHELAGPLLAAGWDVTVRPHPQYLRRFPGKMEALIEQSRSYDSERFRFQMGFSSNETVFAADLLVTDWSNIGYEYALATKKPVLFINTPRKMVNTEWSEEDIRRYSTDAAIRDVIGVALEPGEVGEKAAQTAAELIEKRGDYAEVIENVRRTRLHHFGESGKYGAQYLIDRMVENAKKKQQGRKT